MNREKLIKFVKINFFYFLILTMFIFILLFQRAKIIELLKQKSIYEYLLINASGVLPDEVLDCKSNRVKIMPSLSEGTHLFVTLSPRDCPSCVDEELKFLKIIKKYIPAIDIIIIVSYYPSPKEIGQWLKSMGLDFPYYFDEANNLERLNNLRPSTTWNIIVRRGRYITAFPSDKYFHNKCIIYFIVKLIKDLR